MKTIHKLVLKSYLGPMFLTFFIVMFVLMMNFIWRYIDELVGKGLDAGVIIELMSYAMANMIPMGLPLAMLLAAIMTLGNLGENYELLAMKSAGMSLPKILKPLIIVVGIIAIGSFFVVNNLVPYANKKMLSILYDIRQQKQVIEFQDGLFFNGIEDMSIRVGKQDPKTHLLRDVLIYDNRNINGNMTTTVADSGYIRLSDDKKYLLVTLFNGETYEQTRNYQWYSKSALRHHIFEKQDGVIPPTNRCSGSRSSPTTTRCCPCPTVHASTKADSATPSSPTPSHGSACATGTGCGASHAPTPRTRAASSLSTNRRPRRRSTSSTAARSSGTARFRCRSRS